MTELTFRFFVLIAMLGCAACYDVAYYKIPNILPVAGITWGMLSSASVADAVWKIIAVAALFFLGMLRLMGSGDMKLWMATACIVGFGKSLAVVFISICLLAVYALLVRPQESKGILKAAVYSPDVRSGKTRIEGSAYPFAPFLFLGAACVYVLCTVTGR